MLQLAEARPFTLLAFAAWRVASFCLASSSWRRWMMAFKRRQLLRRLLFVFGVSCVVTRERAAIAAVAASATPGKGTDSKTGSAATTQMEEVNRIGGFFF